MTKGYLSSVGYEPIIKLGPELIVNGNFDTDSAWQKDAGWSISDGVAKSVATTNTPIRNDTTTETGKTYLTEFTVLDYVSGEVQIQASVNGIKRVANGTYKELLTASAVAQISVRADFATGFVGSIDNVSVRELL